MKFIPLQPGADAPAGLSSEYKAARRIGKLALGELHLFFRAGLRTYYVPYRDVRRCFRRVQRISAPGRGRNDLEIENLVICGDAGELAQIQLPGANAAKELMQELEHLIPEAEFGKPVA